MKIDETKLPLDLQAIILTGMNFEQLCNYIAENVVNDTREENESSGSEKENKNKEKLTGFCGVNNMEERG